MANENNYATNITARINVTEPVPNVDINYGPYDTPEIAQQTLDQYGVWDEKAIGLTVGVWKDYTHKKVEEYQLVKNNSGNLELTVKQSEVTPGATNYNALPDKPYINNHELSSGNNTLASIGAASASALSLHTGDSKIHVPMTYGGTTTAITGFKIEGEKMTITVESSEYSFRLTEWHDIADFYILFGAMRRSSGLLYLNINGTDKLFSETTAEDLMTLSVTDYGYQVLPNTEKETITFLTLGDLKTDCKFTSNEISSSETVIMLLTRSSGSNQPSLNFAAVEVPGIEGYYLYNNNSFNVNIPEDNRLTRSNITVGDATYNLLGYFNGNYNGLNGFSKIGINYNK